MRGRGWRRLWGASGAAAVLPGEAGGVAADAARGARHRVAPACGVHLLPTGEQVGRAGAHFVGDRGQRSRCAQVVGQTRPDGSGRDWSTWDSRYSNGRRLSSRAASAKYGERVSAWVVRTAWPSERLTAVTMLTGVLLGGTGPAADAGAEATRVGGRPVLGAQTVAVAACQASCFSRVGSVVVRSRTARAAAW